MIELKTINDLLTEHFVIPDYQRGYRWSERQVTELLDDLLEFHHHADKEEDFYCLQPVVVRQKNEGAWELIDGQQRLTTIKLILGELKVLMDAFGKTSYTITYDTRPLSADFLESPSEDRAENNIDFHHLYEASKAIRQWFEAHDGTLKMHLLTHLISPNVKSVKVIWYQLPSTADPIEAFVRLNVGKIPLTDSELIRALFLRSRNFRSHESTLIQLRIAQEWDLIESSLQRDELWYFLHERDEEPPTRIEGLFQIANAMIDQCKHLPRPNETFLAYQKLFDEGAQSPVHIWRQIVSLSERLTEWYEDRVLYHLIGIWISLYSAKIGLTKMSRPINVLMIAKTLLNQEMMTKIQFESELRASIFKLITSRERRNLTGAELKEILSEHILDLNYEKDRSQIRNVLLVFNVATLLRNSGSNLRFPFNLYKGESWDLEHIRSVSSDMPLRPEMQRRWLEQLRDYWHKEGDLHSDSAHSLRQQVSQMAALDQINRDEFSLLYQKVLSHFNEGEFDEGDHGIGNLTLLDQRTNRSYKNAVFRVKRDRIIGLDKKGTFVPLCTTNVFLKYYSPQVDHTLFWDRDDREKYLDAMINELTHFFLQGHQVEASEL